jgi:hypothetical protein
MPDLKILKQEFAKEFPDWNILHTEVKIQGSAKINYWVVTMEPKVAGKYTIRYTFQRSAYGYANGDREYSIVVGASGCQRTIHNREVYPNLCLGDKLLLPIEINRHFFNYKFYKVSRFSGGGLFANPGNESNRPNFTAQGAIEPAQNHLQYLGQEFVINSTRSGDWNVHWQALFQARNPGFLSLRLQQVPSEKLRRLLESNRRSYLAAEPVEYPIAILPKSQPITTMPYGFHSYDYEPMVSSSTFEHFPFRVSHLRVGDRLWLKYSYARVYREDINSTPSRREDLGNSGLQMQVQGLRKKADLLKVRDRSTNTFSIGLFDSWLLPFMMLKK